MTMIQIFEMKQADAAARTVQKRIALNAFVVAKLECHRTMTAMLKQYGEQLPDLCKAQGATIAGLSALKLHRVVGAPDANDFLALQEDVEAIAKIVDSLIEAIGHEAHSADHHIDLDLFRDQLANALDGNATWNLTAASERAAAFADAAE